MSSVDLYKLFQTATGALKDNRTSLNKADSHNQDHGDNMVEIFEVITQAMKEKKNADPADQLAHASQILRNKSKSGSAKLYAKGLSQASNEFENQKQIGPGNAIRLIQTLMGAGDSASAVSSDNPFGALLSGLSSGGDKGDDAIGADDLLNAGLSFLAAKNRGESNAEALIEAITSGSPLGETPHRAESSQLVMNTLLNVMGTLTQK